jgi:hypothetical protein
MKITPRICFLMFSFNFQALQYTHYAIAFRGDKKLNFRQYEVNNISGTEDQYSVGGEYINLLVIFLSPSENIFYDILKNHKQRLNLLLTWTFI